MNITRRQAIVLIVAVLLTLGALVAFDQFIDRVSPWDYDDFERWMDNLGAWGPIIYMLFFAASMVFAPIPTAPAPVAAAAAFGAVAGFFYTLLAGVLGATLCFGIARRWGRPALERVMAETTVKRIDQLADRLGLRLLVLLRLFPFVGVDYVSYAAGLTHMRFAVYFVVSLLASIPTLVLISVVGENVTENRLVAGIALAVLGAFLLLPLSYYALRKQRAEGSFLQLPASEVEPPAPPVDGAGG